MFARLRRFRSRLRRRTDETAFEFRVENSGLNSAQIETARKGLRILGFDAKMENLSRQDILVFLYAMGLNPTEDILESKLHTYQLGDEETFTFGHLAHIWHSMLQDINDEEDILRRAFQFFDKDGNGEISVQELRTTMHELGDLLSEDEIMSFVQIMDVNNDGVIGYQEFLSTLKTQTPDFSTGAADNEPVAESDDSAAFAGASAAQLPASPTEHSTSVVAGNGSALRAPVTLDTAEQRPPALQIPGRAA